MKSKIQGHDTEPETIPERTVERLCGYRRLLIRWRLQGKDRFFSHELAAEANLTPAQVRRDLMTLEAVGTPSNGYRTSTVIEGLGRLLEGDSGQRVVLVGVGKLGTAILSYFVGRRPDLRIVAAFDRDPGKIGSTIAGVPCHAVCDLERVTREQEALVGILAVPGGSAQEIAEALVSAGVRALLNFAPVKLKVPEGVFVEDLDLSIAMEKAAYFGRMQAERERERGGGAAGPRRTNEAGTHAKGVRRMKKILCIDDDRDLVENYRAILSGEGYAVECASDGAEGLAKARAILPDLIVLDVMMASPTEGFQVAYQIRADAALARVPILMLTGISGETGMKFDKEHDGEFLPVDAFVDKPATPKSLLAAVKRLLELPREEINVEGVRR